jgi:hypothetical protein
MGLLEAPMQHIREDKKVVEGLIKANKMLARRQ